MTSFRMRNAVLLLIAAFACTASGQTQDDRAKAAAGSANARYGTADSLSHNGMEPMSSDQQMSTVDGNKQFGAKMTCPGSKRFMQLTLFPNISNDINRLAVDLDTNFDGVTDYSNLLVGPYAAVCNNGLVQCTAGTTSGCSYWRWKATPNGVVLDRNNANGTVNAQQDLGACYCVNKSCGTNLLTQNSNKVLNDIGTGITRAMQDNYPRLTVARTEQVDPMTQVFYGQETGCSTDSQPEQYYKNPGGMTPAGQSIASDSSSTYHMLISSDVAKDHASTESSCKVYRNLTMSSYWRSDAITISGGTVSSCGQGCYDISVNHTGGFPYGKNGCGVEPRAVTVTVNDPTLVASATLVDATYDDWLRVKVNNIIVWTTDSAWSYPDAYCAGGDVGRSRYSAIGQDITSYLTGVAAGRTVQLESDLTIVKGGGGQTNFRIITRQDCQVSGEALIDQCGVQEGNSDCRLRSENVDGVNTVKDYFTTGLQPLPSTRAISYNGCSKSVTRDWFNKDREYTCKTGKPPYDGSDAQKRYQSIHSSFDPATGNYMDQRKDGQGNWSSSSENIPLSPPQPLPACRSMCKTKKPRPGAAMGQNGAVTQQNSSGVAWDYTYKECGDSTDCPLDAGETVVSACNCSSNFNEAASMMQNIRMVGEDAVCTSRD